MGSYSVEFRRSAELELYGVPFPFRRQMSQALIALQKDARPADAQLIAGKLYRLKVHGWTAEYVVDDVSAIVRVTRIYK